MESMDSQNINQSDSDSVCDEIPGGLYEALGNIAKDLNQILMKQEIVESHIKSASEDLPLLSDQLSDVNRFTEEETHKILEYTEKVMDNHGLLGTKIREVQGVLNGNVFDPAEVKGKLHMVGNVIDENNKILMNILTGLSFQDLAGQRMKRMDVILQDLQARILKLVVTYGMKKRDEETKGSKQRELLNELESSTGVKLAQVEVNDILKEFGF
jgi:chemotaxis protein CheZ